MKNLFIINPVAGKGRSLEYIDKIKNYFDDLHEEYIIEITKYKDHAIEIAKEYTSKDTYRVFAVGGDGTINEVLNGLIGSDSVLCVIPTGTGNDFVRTLYKDKDIEDVLDSLISGQEHYIDLAKSNDRYFINIASVGFDAEVVYNARMFKNRRFIPSSFAYILSVIYTAFNFKSINMTIKIGERSIKESTFLLAACNGKCYGGGVMIAPKADMKDGLLDICVIRRPGLFTLLKSIPKALKGELEGIEEVNYYSGKKIIVEGDREFILNADGELFRQTQAEFELIENGMKVVIPF
ncbi:MULTISPECIES: diacylglycerol/lipid kinase family protein [unclassified Clostridium]|uniref:diacylglycerol/lipid kinase family protein n=1 Tax=unclassified Clostridium TaxID=2614128 RepID=UPI0025BF47F1|nr:MULTISPECIES: diacylglycerol kinase family protein [unclassified Clostridium]